MKTKTKTPTRPAANAHNGQTAANANTRSSIDDQITLLMACFKLSASIAHDTAGGFYFWPHVEGFEIENHIRQCGICTNGARLIAKKFGGFVAGYSIDPEDPQTLVGADVFGHDFAVIGSFIVDWWGWEYEQSIQSPVMAIAEGLTLGKYKPEQSWEILPSHDFRKVANTVN